MITRLYLDPKNPPPKVEMQKIFGQQPEVENETPPKQPQFSNQYLHMDLEGRRIKCMD